MLHGVKAHCPTLVWEAVGGERERRRQRAEAEAWGKVSRRKRGWLGQTQKQQETASEAKAEGACLVSMGQSCDWGLSPTTAEGRLL